MVSFQKDSSIEDSFGTSKDMLGQCLSSEDEHETIQIRDKSRRGKRSRKNSKNPKTKKVEDEVTGELKDRIRMLEKALEKSKRILNLKNIENNELRKELNDYKKITSTFKHLDANALTINLENERLRANMSRLAEVKTS